MSNEQDFQHLSNDPIEPVIPVVDNESANSVELDNDMDSEPSQSADPMNQNEATQVKAGEATGDSTTNSTQSNNRRKWIIGGSAAALVLTTGIGIGANIAHSQEDAQPQGNDQSTNELSQQPIDQSGIDLKSNTVQIPASPTKSPEVTPSEETTSTSEAAPSQKLTLNQDMIDGLMKGEGYTDAMIGELQDNVNRLSQYPDIIKAMQSSDPREMLNAFCIAFQDGFKDNDPSLPSYLVLPGAANESIDSWAPDFLQNAIINKDNQDPEQKIVGIQCGVGKADDVKHAITFASDNNIANELAAAPDQAFADQFGNYYIASKAYFATINSNNKPVTVTGNYDVVYYIETLTFTGPDGKEATLGFLQDATVNEANIPKINK